MKCDLSVSGEMLTAYLDGEIDHHSVKPVREQIDAAIEQYEPKALALDFGKVSFMDSSGIGLVMGRFRNLQRYGSQLYIFNPNAYIGKVMRLAGMDKLAKIQNDRSGKKEKK